MTFGRAALVLLASAAVLFVLVRLLEPRLAFFPFRGETTTPKDLGFEYKPLTIETRDGERLRAWNIAPGTLHNPPSTLRNPPSTLQHPPSTLQHPPSTLQHPPSTLQDPSSTLQDPPSTQGAFVVYFHGNGANLSNWAPIVCGLAGQGYPVLAFDYRGYGVSSGTPTEKGLYRDVDAIVDYLWTRVKPAGPVIYWGRSLGVSMAAYAATRRQPAGLILESGFPDARSLFRAPSPMALLALFSSYRFPAAEYLRAVKIPTLVMHGDADSVIPYEQGRALYEQIEGPKAFFTIKGGDHNDATARNEVLYWQAVREFIDNS